MFKQARFLKILIGFLVLIGIGSSASFYFRESANAGLTDFPINTAIHVILGGLYMAFAPFQFIPKLRQRWPNYHRFMGRFLVLVGILVGLTATFMAVITPYSGWSERILITPFTILFSLSLINGYRHIRAKRIAEHHAWMIRAFAIGLSVSTMRLIFLPLLLFIIFKGNPTHDNIAMASTASFTLALLSHVIIAELWIREKVFP